MPSISHHSLFQRKDVSFPFFNCINAAQGVTTSPAVIMLAYAKDDHKATNSVKTFLFEEFQLQTG
jgi:hypothetical protein